MSFSPLIDSLIQALRCLPGVGPKSAQRMVFHLLQHGQNQALQLADCLQQTINNIQRCERCHNFCESPICKICSNLGRDNKLLCIVESPADVLAIEQTASYRGLYFVLMGHLSPIDGIGPAEIGIDLLNQQLQQHKYSEVILATSATIEGEATAQFISILVKKHGITASRIAHGVPMGSELEYIDGSTLSRALTRRELLN